MPFKRNFRGATTYAAPASERYRQSYDRIFGPHAYDKIFTPRTEIERDTAIFYPTVFGTVEDMLRGESGLNAHEGSYKIELDGSF